MFPGKSRDSCSNRATVTVESNENGLQVLTFFEQRSSISVQTRPVVCFYILASCIRHFCFCDIDDLIEGQV